MTTGIEKKKKIMRLFTEMSSYNLCVGAWVTFTYFYLFTGFLEIAIISRNYRLTPEKANVISSAVLTMELLCVFESGT